MRELAIGVFALADTDVMILLKEVVVSTLARMKMKRRKMRTEVCSVSSSYKIQYTHYTKTKQNEYTMYRFTVLF